VTLAACPRVRFRDVGNVQLRLDAAGSQPALNRLPLAQGADARLSEDQTTRLLATVQAYEAWLAGCAASPPAGYIILSKLGAFLRLCLRTLRASMCVCT